MILAWLRFLPEVPCSRIPTGRSGRDWSTSRTDSNHFRRSRKPRSTCMEIVRGIGKHGPGENLFLVFKDPDGNYCEFYAEMVQVTVDTPHTARVWDNDLKAFDQWEFEKFVVPPPAWGPSKQS